MSLTVRIASDDDGPRIGELGREQGFPIDDIDWSRVNPYWLVAEDDGRIIGALQFCLALPMGWLEMMFINQELSHRERAQTVKALVERGLLALKAFGAQLAMGSVSLEMKSFKRIMKRRGGVVLSSGSLMAKRL